MRVLLGAAPGVGKTFAMLEEGHQLLAAGRDVAVGVVEAHGRAATAALLDGLELVPTRTALHRGVELQELDLGAVLRRAPKVALVDELAHTNAPGGEHEKRWQDVAALLDAGIDVISTVNVQHLESLGDVVEQITGVRQRETVPDAVLRDADRVELVDLQPQALRARLEAGEVYPAARVDAALSNYFRLGNLTALRELALLWLADEVDQALQRYREQQGIDATWETRERVVVALTGGTEGETLLKRGARIAARSSGGDLLAVHVQRQDGLVDRDPAALAAQRALVERLGGSFHTVVGDDVPKALVQFARASHATQLVIGASRRGWLQTALTGPGIGQAVVRESGDIDVHMVAHAAAGQGRRLPSLADAPLSKRRQLAGWALAMLGVPLLTWLLDAAAEQASVTADALLLQLWVVVVALVGGIWAATFAALLAGVLFLLVLVEPRFTFAVAEPWHIAAVVVLLASALLVSWVVDRAARTTRAAGRSAAESELLAAISSGVLGGQGSIQVALTRTREALGLTGVRLLQGERVVAIDGEPADGAGESARAPTAVPVGDDATLELHGRMLDAGERRILDVVVHQLAASLRHRSVAAVASELEPLAEQDRVRSALLRAVGHDLRRPLAAAATSVGALRSASIPLDDAARAELLETADESLETLARLVTDLLDVSRVEAGALAVAARPIELDDVIVPALEEVGASPAAVALELGEVPRASADPVLLQRVLVNLLGNALRHSPASTPVTIVTSAFGDAVEVRIADRGPGIAPAERDRAFVPFQRLGDTDNDAGLGLGLALSRGFTDAMGGSLEAETTPGGGLTMVVRLRRAPDEEST
nr:ATP-binding protein [Agrococcus sp. ARC_14]